MDNQQIETAKISNLYSIGCEQPVASILTHGNGNKTFGPPIIRRILEYQNLAEKFAKLIKFDYQIIEGFRFAINKYYCAINSNTLYKWKFYSDVAEEIKNHLKNDKLYINDNVKDFYIRISMEKPIDINDPCWSRDTDLLKIENM